MIHKSILTKKNLILGSNSPRRREILSNAGFTFKTMVFDFDENYPCGLPLEEVSKFIASKKNSYYASYYEDSIVLCSDTTVILDGESLSKPNSEEEAYVMLKNISGKTHQVITGVSIKTSDKEVVFSDTTYVTFMNLKENDIWAYVSSGNSLDKAGGYGIQDSIGMIGISKIEGSYFNVMGLPIHLVYQHLLDFCEKN